MKQTIDFDEKPELIVRMSFRELDISDTSDAPGLLDDGEVNARRIIEGIATIADIDDNLVEVTPAALRAAENDLLLRSTILENHMTERPIGRVLSSKYDPATKSLKIRGFISEVENDVWRKIKEGILNKLSISWRNLQVERVFDEKLRSDKLVVHDMRIFEVSVVSVPAIAEADITGWVERTLNERNVTIINRAAPYSSPYVVPFRKDRAAPKSKRWDAASAVRRLRRRAGGVKSSIDWGTYAEGFAYVQVDGTRFSDYKFPVRDVVGGQLVSVFKAVQSAASRLQSSNIPDVDKRIIANRLFREYREIHEVEMDDIPKALIELAQKGGVD